MQGKFKLRYIFIPVLAVLLMSHNVGAIDYTQNVRMIRVGNGSVYDLTGSAYCTNQVNHYTFGNRNSITNFNASNACSTTSIAMYAGHNEFLAGDIVQVDLIFNQLENNNSLDSWMYNISTTSSSPFILSKVEMENSGASTSIVHYYFLTGRYTTEYEIYLQGLFNLPPSTVVSGGPVSTWRIQNADYSAITNSLDDVVDAIQDSAESNQEYQEKEEQAIENIENQTPQDISQSGSTENAQTSSLLQTVGGLLTALQSMQTGSCSVQLPLPNFAGGAMTVNICQGKDKTGNLVSIFGSVALIVFYIPLAWKLISMIYSEIRSFTNG